jgi:Sel1 repeat
MAEIEISKDIKDIKFYIKFTFYIIAFSFVVIVGLVGFSVYLDYKFKESYRYDQEMSEENVEKDEYVISEGEKLLLRSQSTYGAYEKYLIKDGHKAFAISSSGAYSYVSGRFEKKNAIKDVLANCNEYVSKFEPACQVLNVDNTLQEVVFKGGSRCKKIASNCGTTEFSKEEIEGRAKLGDKWGIFILGKSYLFGSPYHEQNEEKGVGLILKSANMGYREGIEWAGYIYEKGYGVNVDLKEARKWYLMAVEKGSDYAELQLDNLESN